MSHWKPSAAKGPHAGYSACAQATTAASLSSGSPSTFRAGRPDWPRTGDLLAEDICGPAEVILIVFLVPRPNTATFFPLSRAGVILFS